MFGSSLPSLWSLSNQSLLGSGSRHCYVITSSIWEFLPIYLRTRRLGVRISQGAPLLLESDSCSENEHLVFFVLLRPINRLSENFFDRLTKPRPAQFPVTRRNQARTNIRVIIHLDGTQAFNLNSEVGVDFTVSFCRFLRSSCRQRMQLRRS